MPDTKITCLKNRTCQLRKLIGEGHKGQLLHLAARFIVDCPEVRGCRCDEINDLATTGFEETHHIVRIGIPTR